eukprot:2536-Heterococcus_DN1.PRE.3
MSVGHAVVPMQCQSAYCYFKTCILCHGSAAAAAAVSVDAAADIQQRGVDDILVQLALRLQ